MIRYYSSPIPFSSLYPSLPGTPIPSSILPPLQFMSIGLTYKFLSFSISYAILNLPLSILYLPFMLLTPCNFSPISLFPLPTDIPPCDLHFCDSVTVLVVCLVHFLSLFLFLGSIVDRCEFVVILLFIVLIFFFLDKPFNIS